ncbi:DMT family transporter [Xinfangfangia sp. CPCC 101601]|uniref:DMT family transporter n=1 Tax=Pseudogemmobacter lacusdianii TaxID=3069608 RepID=A0ABU0W0F4_9RHOB|nr:DMT family transporter [Xinfangfangia sp. CPCC 101601]MDQ2066600.1 DMT family transporter [Xinfangfangia sp. CPCC 101601]
MIPSSNASPTRGILLMILAIFCFTLMDATAKGLIEKYSAPLVIWVRFAGQLLIVLAILGPRVKPMMRTNFPVLHAWRSLFQFGATAFFFLSLPFIGLSEATAITDINPVLITLGAALFLGERLGPRRVAGVVAALIGALIIIRPGAGAFNAWAILPLCCAISYAGSALLTRKIGAQEPVWGSMIYAALFGTIVAGCAVPFVWQQIEAVDLWKFVVIGCLGTLAQLCIIRSFSITEAGIVAPFAYLGIIFATFWGAIFYDQWPDRWSVIGALVIVVAGLYVWRRETIVARRAR